MKKTFLSVALALAGVAAFTTAQATPISWSYGDVFLGFENAAGTKDYLYDFGSGSALASAVQNGTFTPVNLNADLTNAFGSDWYTNTTTGLEFGAFGMTGNKSIVYASVASGNPALPFNSASALSTTLTHYATMAASGSGGYTYDLNNGQALTLGVYQLPTGIDGGVTSWTGNTPTTTPFLAYNVSIENGVAGNLDFYGTTGSASTLYGTFKLSSAGVLSVAAVPEPSTYALCGVGAVLLLIAYRRRRSA